MLDSNKNGLKCGLKKAKRVMIETERLILRPFNENDTEDVFEYLE